MGCYDGENFITQYGNFFTPGTKIVFSLFSDTFKIVGVAGVKNAEGGLDTKPTKKIYKIEECTYGEGADIKLRSGEHYVFDGFEWKNQ